MIFFKVAWHNMVVRGRRTIMILFSVALSVAVILFVSGMIEGVKKNFFRNMLEESGHVQILPKGSDTALNPYDLTLLLPNPDDMVKKLSENSEILRVEKVLSFGSVLLAGNRNLTITGCGINRESRFFSKARGGIYVGEFLGKGKEGAPGIAMSKRIAELLDIGVGDSVVVLVEDSTGSPWYVEYPVTGFFQTDSKEFDEGSFFIDLDEAQKLLYVPGECREIRILLKAPQTAEAFADRLKSDPLFAAHAEIKDWKEIHGSYLVLLQLFDVFFLFINIFTIVVAATVITNSILMNVFEQTREYGTLRAIGMKRRQLFGLILTEGILQGIIGSLMGLAIGIPAVLYFRKYGMRWGEITESFGLGDAVYFAFSPQQALSSLVAGVLIACVGSLYAGVVSSKQSIMESLRAL
ncbi:ABC transporter permease [Sediminispirochaeta bajacaliforniensis]|uniref:ABC transporter permease n=1 Tax=Sediminispirochaeta bajacaliforniensis TaxID=148 RepID=UPI0003820331|nr:FtsX-like permease family protein [Sediminispirochaeta bajacaliforniensis]